MKRPAVTLVEMGLRDGLQNESINLSIETRIEIAQRLVDAGLRRIEVGSFVRPDKVPQMAGSKEVIEKLYALQKEKRISKSVQFSALVPNETGMEIAMQTPIREIAIFAASSESFSIKNINCTIDESFERFVPVMSLAQKHKIPVRGYLSTCFGCPFEGKISEEKVIKLTQRLLRLGCYEVSIGDTIGVAHPGQIESFFRKLKKKVPLKKIAGHFHDTRGTAVVNIYTAYQLGVRTFDASFGGLGGCPYAPGATGNVATEDVAYMFEGMKVKTGLQLPKLIELSHWVGAKMGKSLPSRVSNAGLLVPLGKVSR